MKYVLDTHSHTIASGHAYSTIREMARSAAKQGLELLGITDHAPMMPGTCSEMHFNNFKVIDKEMYGVELLLGTELNILNYKGQVDLPNSVLRELDIVIASLHIPCIHPGTIEDNTSAYLHVMKNPYVDIIGHPDDSRYKIDYKELVLASKESRILLEINNSSLTPGGVRQNPLENDITILTYCRQYNVPVVLGSDAHIDSCVGKHNYVEDLINDIDFPEELIVNKSVAELKKLIRRNKF